MQVSGSSGKHRQLRPRDNYSPRIKSHVCIGRDISGLDDGGAQAHAHAERERERKGAASFSISKRELRVFGNTHLGGEGEIMTKA
jgi:hypothetical protein